MTLAAEPNLAPLPRRRPRHTLLVVDDEQDVVKSVKDLLRLDYKVLGVTSTAEALEVLAREPVHVVMTDQRMPEMTGVQFLAQVKERHPEVVRVLFTGYADVRAVIDAINHGQVWRYVTKPWEPDELAAVIREACERYDLVRERNDLLERLTKQNAALEAANENLAVANAELTHANALKHAFIQVVSHELRTPLTILQGMVRLAGHVTGQIPAAAAGSGGGPGGPVPVLQNYLDRIDRAGRRLQYLVDQIVSMLVANRFERTVNREPAALAPLLRDAAEDVRPFVELRKQSLVIDVPADLGTMSLEPVGIRDAINHLLLNAIKFTPDGGTVRLSATRADGRGDAVVTVSDTGEGMDAETQRRLFQPFFTGFDVSRHCSGTYEYGRRGLGLGLTIVKNLVRLHDGTIDVASAPGAGTTFTITLPDRPTSAP